MNDKGYDRLARGVNYSANKYKHQGNAAITTGNNAKKKLVRGSNQTLKAAKQDAVYRPRTKDAFKRVAKAGTKGIA